MEETLDVYKKPFDPKYPQVCMDETSKQLLEEVRPKIAACPGHVECYDSEYKRNGTANIFIAFEPLAGVRFTKVTEQRTNIDWAEFARELVDKHYPDA